LRQPPVLQATEARLPPQLLEYTTQSIFPFCQLKFRRNKLIHDFRYLTKPI